jgi:GcrA cell cycle regulator
MDWTDEVIERLRAFWAEGLSTAEIGRRMGVSKNAVVGKAHRLGLTARPSPIKRSPGGEAPRRTSIRRSVGPTLPPFSEPAEPEPAALPLVSMPMPVPLRVAIIPPAPVAPPPVHAPSLRSVGRSSGGGRVIPCCWPIGEPGTRSFRFCDSASAAGKPYCAEHAALAYVKIRDRREDAA